MARPKILVFQHVPYEPLGTLDPLLKEAGFRIRYVNFGRVPESRPGLDGYEALQRDISVLGICLGAQLLAKALGGSVDRNETREIGWYDVELTPAGIDDPVLSTFSDVQRVFQWHEDGIILPPGAVHLAASNASRVQAFRQGEHAYGFQFHLEVNRSLIERWLTVPANQIALQDEAGRIDAESIRKLTAEYVNDLEELSRATFSRWIDRFEIGPRRRSLPSR